MALVRVGRGQPVTLFAPGEFHDGQRALAQLRDAAQGVRGTRLLFDYEQSGYFDQVPPLRRQAERDAAEVLVVADVHGASQAMGISRGARAVLGAVAEEPARFERVVLALPPGGNAVGYFREWLAGLTPGRSPVAGDVLVVGLRGDRWHPAVVAEEWARRLAAELLVFDKKADPDAPRRVHEAARTFLNAGRR